MLYLATQVTSTEERGAEDRHSVVYRAPPVVAGLVAAIRLLTNFTTTFLALATTS